ncbi:cell cycle and apoptosis regulator protein 2 [Oxyura jamaicensis]|uniref:cell cycle and apoptosis regulator protein 2 n=1 Tax=Oxyura jamaicensis TaxID=8884 RepID=UPI0015A5F7EF|nr:cell cycle and apoptosis regulator protein 2 [Oxyura jamaicensis]
MAQFKWQPPPPRPPGGPFPGPPHSSSLLGPPPGLLTPPVPPELLQGTRHLQVGEKQRVFIGVVSSLHDYFGVVDEEVFFQLSVVKGRVPQIGEKVLVKAAYSPGQAVPWNALKVQTLSNQPLLKAPAPLLHAASLGQKQGILGAQPQLLFQSHRVPPLCPQKPVNFFPSPPSIPLSHLGRQPGRGARARSDAGRRDDSDSKKRKQKGAEPWAAKKPRHDVPQYRVHLAPYAPDSPSCDAMEVLRRYCSIPLPGGFYDIRLRWLDAFPLGQPLSLRHRSRILVADPDEVPEPQVGAEQDPAPHDTDSAFSAKVLLLSSPGLEEFYRTCLLYVGEADEPREAPEHPTKQIKFLLGRKEDEAVLIGGEWSPSLDGPDPEADPMVLVRTAVRCARAQAGLDLSGCSKWVRFAEFRYLREGDASRREVVVVFLPDVWGCMPSLEEWEAAGQLREEKGSSLPPSPEEDTATVRLCRGSGCQGCSSDVPNCGFSCERPHFGKGERPAQLAASSLPPFFFLADGDPRARGEAACSNISLYTLLEYRRRREKLSFEVAVVAELFQEMLQRDFGYKLYKALLALPEKEEPLENKNPEGEREPETAREVAPGAARVEEAEKHPPKEEAEEPVGNEVATAGGEQERAKSEGRAEPKDSPDELCVLSLEGSMLLLPEEEEEELGAKLEEAEVRSDVSNHSEPELSSPQDVPKELHPSAALPLDALLAFVYFDLNFCGYLHRRDLERILLTLGLRLCKEQAKRLVNRVVTQSLCHYRNLRYSRTAIPAGSLPRVVLLPGNLPLLPPAPTEVPPCPNVGLVSHGGTVLNVGKLLEKAEQAESSRLYLEGKIHALEAKLEQSQLRVAATEASNRALAAELRDLQRRLDEAEERAREAGRQKLRLGRLLQESRKRLAPLQLELQAILEKTSSCLEEEPASSS